MKLKLDTKTVTALALGKAQNEEFAWDTELEGFGLRLRRSSSGVRRTYVAQYRVKGHTRRSKLGSAEKLTPIQARDAARKILAQVELGHDPQGEKKAQRAQAAHVFRSVVEAYLAVKHGELRPVSYRITKLYLTGPYFRPLHTMGIAEISHPDIAARLSAIPRNHSANTAAAARRAISALFRWAMEEGWLQSNPVIGTRKPAEVKPRDRVLSDAEMVAVWKACQDDEFGRIVQLLILLGCRRQEVGGLRWSELDLNAGTWRLPEERSKNHRAHTLVLPQLALEIIAAVPRRTGRDHLFGVRGPRGFVAWTASKACLDARLNGGVQPWRLHDLRRTVATRMADIGILPHTIEAALNHQSGHKAGIAGVYNRSLYGREVKAALAQWSEHVLALVEGRKSKVAMLRA
jgi:integrase